MSRPKEFDIVDRRLRVQGAPIHLRVITVFGQDELLELTLDPTPVRNLVDNLATTEAANAELLVATNYYLHENGDRILAENGDILTKE